MKLIKEELTKAGVAEATAEQILAELNNSYVSKEDVKANFVDKKTAEAEKNTASTKLKDYEKFIKDVTGLVGADSQEKVTDAISALKQSLKDKDTTHKTEMTKLQREYADKELLTNYKDNDGNTYKAKNSKAVSALLEAIDEKVDIDTYKQMRKTQIETLVKGEDTAFLFNTEKKGTKPFAGAELGNKGGQKPQDNNLSLEQKMAIANGVTQ